MARSTAASGGSEPAPRRSAHGAPDAPVLERHHRDVRGGGPRAAVLGLQDGLVSSAAVILGVAGAHPVASLVRIVGLAVLVGGAFSMASSELVSMKAQRELLERELELERREIRLRPEGEYRELAHIYERRGLDPPLARQVAGAIMQDPERALEAHAREELGIDPTALGSPFVAASASFFSFAVGALAPLLPWFVTTGHAAVLATVGVGVVAALGAGWALSLFTGQPAPRSALRQVAFVAVPAAVTYGIGAALGVSGIG